MGLASDLGYELGDQSRVRKRLVELAGTRLVSAVNRKILRPVDRMVLRLTRGHNTLTTWASGIPTLWLTTVGARSGESRTVPLLGIPINDDLALLGTSFGQKRTPAWVHNLVAHPDAVVSIGERRVEVTARPATPGEEAEIWERAALVYPGYSNYARWAGHRELRVFVLETRRNRLGNDLGRGRVGS
jgi:deazaflavin-dependent oxidoreductase (nitroreductase family)